MRTYTELVSLEWGKGTRQIMLDTTTSKSGSEERSARNPCLSIV